jgi:hypothetical protein
MSPRPLVFFSILKMARLPLQRFTEVIGHPQQWQLTISMDDNNLDIVVASTGSKNLGSVSILFSIGDGTFTNKVKNSTGFSVFFVDIADINYDNEVDIIVGHINNFGVLYTYCH